MLGVTIITNPRLSRCGEQAGDNDEGVGVRCDLFGVEMITNPRLKSCVDIIVEHEYWLSLLPSDSV